MRQQILKTGSTGMTLVVKKVKGRLYVYEQYRFDGKVVTRYIGPLEEMAYIYQAYRQGLTVNYRPKRGAYKQLAKLIVEDVVNRLAKQWCGGRDLNPRRPTPADLESAPLVQARAPPLRPENDLEGAGSISVSPRKELWGKMEKNICVFLLCIKEKLFLLH